MWKFKSELFLLKKSEKKKIRFFSLCSKEEKTEFSLLFLKNNLALILELTFTLNPPPKKHYIIIFRILVGEEKENVYPSTQKITFSILKKTQTDQNSWC